jgi:hypothetical protein
MSEAKLSICNMALAALGEEAIRSFDENNKRARQVYIFFDLAHNKLLSKYNWNFARRMRILQPLAVDSPMYIALHLPETAYAYPLPEDCLVARYLWPPNRRIGWETQGRNLICAISSDDGIPIRLVYTAKISDTSLLSEGYRIALSLSIALLMAPAYDKKMVNAIMPAAQLAEIEAINQSAQQHNTAYDYARDPNNDSFINPDASTYTPAPFMSDPRLLP